MERRMEVHDWSTILALIIVHPGCCSKWAKPCSGVWTQGSRPLIGKVADAVRIRSTRIPGVVTHCTHIPSPVANKVAMNAVAQDGTASLWPPHIQQPTIIEGMCLDVLSLQRQLHNFSPCFRVPHSNVSVSMIAFDLRIIQIAEFVEVWTAGNVARCDKEDVLQPVAPAGRSPGHHPAHPVIGMEWQEESHLGSTTMIWDPSPTYHLRRRGILIQYAHHLELIRTLLQPLLHLARILTSISLLIDDLCQNRTNHSMAVCLCRKWWLR
mmetsp:Transcript_70900/g.169778  ORF Transcript_70900/g.169778 Transcript_70900/m.169778 type:complete len:267 (-) Transcript_70900:164-964(-)